VDVKVKVGEKVGVEVNPPKLVDVGVGVKVQLPQRVTVKVAVGAVGEPSGEDGPGLVEQANGIRQVSPSDNQRPFIRIFFMTIFLHPSPPLIQGVYQTS
jgi:hypothetical protein